MGENVRPDAGSRARWRVRAIAAGALAAIGLVVSVACTSTGAGSDAGSPGGSSLGSGSSTPAAGATTGGTAEVASERLDVTMEVDPGLVQHTVYRPTDLDAVDGLLPIVVVAQGACMLPGDSYRELFSEIAAHGYLVVADQEPGKPAPDTPELLTAGIDWAVAENTRSGSPYEGRLDTGAIATTGHSCGGLIALHVGANDPRVTSVLALDSGIFDAGTMGGATKADLQELHSPTMWLNTGPMDVAYPQAVKDFAAVPDDVPAAFANYDLSERGPELTGAHFGTVIEPRGGEQGRVMVLWFDLTLQGSEAARDALLPPTCGICTDPRWTVEAKHWPAEPG